MWYPLNGSDLPTAAAEGAENVAVSIKPEDAPQPDALIDWIQTEKDLSVDETLSLGFAPFSFDESGNHRTIVLDAMRYCERNKIRWGVGIRFVLHAWSENTTVKGSVALVAAQASLNMAYTRATFQVVGCGDPGIGKLLPNFEEMSVSSYADLMKAIDACRDAVLSSPSEKLVPTPIAISLPSPTVKPRSRWHLHHA
jgi:hypothetical protein